MKASTLLPREFPLPINTATSVKLIIKVKGWVIPPEKNSDFVAHIEQVLDVYKRPYNSDCPVICKKKELVSKKENPPKSLTPGDNPVYSWL